MKLAIILSAFGVLFLANLSSAQFFFGARTCISRCGMAPTLVESLTGLCGCSTACEAQENCCYGYWRYCSMSCRERCGTQYHPLLACQCYENCTGDSCCKDYKSVCVDGIIPPLPTKSTRAPPTSPPSTTPLPMEKGFSYILNREIECPTGVQFQPCPDNPCQHECERHPGANCLVNQCGNCEAKYFDIAGNELDCYDPDKYCSTGQRIFDCEDTDLCAGTSCPGFPRAICVPNKCGGCYYDFVDEKGNIVVDCEIEHSEPPSPCAAGVELMECTPPPCAGQICAADITAKCRNIRCGECKAEFYNSQGSVVDCEDREPPACSHSCERDPCIGATCPAIPNAYQGKPPFVENVNLPLMTTEKLCER